MSPASHCPHCGAELSRLPSPGDLCVGCLLKIGINTPMAPVAPAPEPPPSIPGFRILRELGAGGMGRVYLAEEEALARRVAVKVLTGGGTARHDAEADARFLREARAMAAVEHPNVVSVYRVGRTEEGRVFMAMEHVAGETLAEWLRRRTRVSAADALRLVRQTVEALAAAWERGVVHRDIKPSNLFVDREDRVRVGDFGLALPVGSSSHERLTLPGTLLGTPTYLSPEQATGAPVDFRADLYSLGIVLFEVLTGAPPFVASNPFEVVHQHLHRELPPLPPGCPDETQMLLHWMTAKDPGHRPSSHRELLDAIDGALACSNRSALQGGAFAASVTAGRFVPRGPLVAKRCDRYRQMMAFARHFREHRARLPGQPVAYLLPGAEGHCHDSLVERFIHEHVAEAMDRGPKGGNGVLVYRLGWPEGEHLSELKTYLVTDLFTQLDAAYTGVDTSAAALAQLKALSASSAVIVSHEIRSGQLSRHGVELIDWYLDDFWGGFPARPSAPQVVIFLSLIYSDRSFVQGWRSWLPSPFSWRRSLERRLVATGAAGDGKVPRLLLAELGPVTLDHVKEWLSRHNIFDSERERQEAAEGLFSGSRGKQLATLPMAEVEVALSQIHARFLKRKGAYR